MDMKKRRIVPIPLIVLICGSIGLGYASFRHFSHFNRVVLEKFQGRLWELPARVYARPLELYPGMPLTSPAFEEELKLMGYLQAAHPAGLDTPGKFLRKGNTFRLILRPFRFEDGEASSKKIHMIIRGGKVDFLKETETNAFPDMVRLDPTLIGSFYPRHYEDRVLVTLKKAPPLLLKTLLAVEDQGFYDHHGIEPVAIFRAAMANIRKRRLVQGASTITQQLAKNFFLTNEKTLTRKLNEMFMAIALEKNYGKDEILEAYLNEVYLGQDGKRAIHGFGLASSFHFGKSLDDLRAQEIALLVGLLKGPSYYDPRAHPERALKRRNTVLQIMRDHGLIRIDIADRAIPSPLNVIPDPPKGASRFPAYLDLVRRQLLQEYRDSDLRSAGLRVFTAFDPQVQLAGEKAVTSHIRRLEKRGGVPKGKLQASAVMTSTAGNEVLGMIGGRNFSFKGFNRALDAKRPIGSLIKPAVFLTALSRPERYTLTTSIDDSHIQFQDERGRVWVPQNYDREYHGDTPLYLALAHSYNVSTVRLGMELGLPDVFQTLGKMGFTRDIKPYPSALLGTVEMSPLEVAQIYQTLAAGGFYSPIRAIRSVERPDGVTLQRYSLTVRQSLAPGPVYLLNSILQVVVLEGTAQSVKTFLPEDMGAAGKTGTTNDLKDSWFAGFTGNHLAVVWVGRDDNQSCGLTGASGALQIWGQLMAALPNTPLELPEPQGMEWAVVDAEADMLTDDACENAMTVPFIKGSAPTQIISCPAAGQDVRVQKPEQDVRVQRPEQDVRVQRPEDEEKDETKESALTRWLRRIFKKK